MPLGDFLAEIHHPLSKLEVGGLFQKTDRKPITKLSHYKVLS